MSATTVIKSMFIVAILVSAVRTRAQEATAPLTTTTPVTADATVAVEQSRSDTYFTNWTSRWKMFMGGIDSEQGKDEGAAVMLRVRGKFDSTLVPTLDVHLEPVVDLFAGRVEERFDDNTYQSKLWLSDSYLNYHPVSFLELHGGTIGQKFLSLDEDHENGLVVSHNEAFPRFFRRS